MSAFELGLGVYAACVDFELRLGALLGLTYRDVTAASWLSSCAKRSTPRSSIVACSDTPVL